MPKLSGFASLAALPEERVTDKITRKIVAGDQEMIVWWSMKAGAHATAHKHPHEQIAWMLKGKMEFRLGRALQLRAGRRGGDPGRRRARGVLSRGHRGDRRVCAAASGFSDGRHARLHEGQVK